MQKERDEDRCQERRGDVFSPPVQPPDQFENRRFLQVVDPLSRLARRLDRAEYRALQPRRLLLERDRRVAIRRGQRAVRSYNFV